MFYVFAKTKIICYINREMDGNFKEKVHEMKKFSISQIVLLIILVSNVHAATFTFNETFDNQQSVFTDHNWQPAIYNYTSTGWNYAFDYNGHNFAVTNLYYGNQNPASWMPNNVQVNFFKGLTVIDGAFSFSYEFGWSGSKVSDGFTHHIYMRTSTGHYYGGGVTDMWQQSRGSGYLYAENGTVSTGQQYSGQATLNGYSGSGLVTISRNEQNEMSIVITAGGLTMNLANIMSQPMIETDPFNFILISYAGYNPNYYNMTFPTLYSDNIYLQGESSFITDPEPETIPEPITILFFSSALVGYFLKNIQKVRNISRF